MKKIFAILLAVFIIGCSKTGNDANERFTEGPKAGGQAVDFLYRDMDNVPFRLSEKKGSVVILYFWRMKCEPCRAELAALQKLYDRYKDRGLVIVSVGADTMHSSPIHEVKELLQKNQVTYVTMRDSEGFVAEAYGVLKAPTAVIIDKSGTIAEIRNTGSDWMGAQTGKLIERLIGG